MIDNKTRQLFESKLEYYVNLYNSKTGNHYDKPIMVIRPMGLRAGLAHYSKNLIELNESYCQNGHLEDMLNITLGHELAHIFSFKTYGYMGTGHKMWWKVTMRALELKSNRCHNYNTDGVRLRNRNTTRYTYLCNCRKHEVSMTIHNRITKFNRKYKCNFCKTYIKFETVAS